MCRFTILKEPCSSAGDYKGSTRHPVMRGAGIAPQRQQQWWKTRQGRPLFLSADSLCGTLQEKEGRGLEAAGSCYPSLGRL